MRLGCDISNLCNRFGDEKVFELFYKSGFECVDYSFNEIKPLERLLNDDYVKTAKEIRIMLDESGLVCNQTHAPFQFEYGEKMDLSEKHYRDVIRAMEFSAILGAERIIIHAVTPPEEVDIYAYNREYYRSFLPFCENLGIEVAVENIGRGHTDEEKRVGIWGSPEAFCEFIHGLDSKWFCACVDLGHAAIMNCPPEEFIARMDAELLKTLHVHDTDFVNDCHTVPYLQKQNWEAIMRSLARIGYKGDFNLEVLLYTEKFPDELIETALKFASGVGRYLVNRFVEVRDEF